MLNNLTNFFNIIKEKFIKKTLDPSDLIAIGTKDYRYGGGYKPTAIKFSDLQAQLGGGSTPSYKVYTALLTQTDDDDPVATVLENTLGGTVVWTRSVAGYYIGTLAGTFTTNKTAILLGNNRYTLSNATLIKADIVCYSYNQNTVEVSTVNETALVDDILANTFIEIRVYP
jgi:hypothetical protein